MIGSESWTAEFRIWDDRAVPGLVRVLWSTLVLWTSKVLARAFDHGDFDSSRTFFFLQHDHFHYGKIPIPPAVPPFLFPVQRRSAGDPRSGQGPRGRAETPEKVFRGHQIPRSRPPRQHRQRSKIVFQKLGGRGHELAGGGEGQVFEGGSIGTAGGGLADRGRTKDEGVYVVLGKHVYQCGNAELVWEYVWGGRAEGGRVEGGRGAGGEGWRGRRMPTSWTSSWKRGTGNEFPVRTVLQFPRLSGPRLTIEKDPGGVPSGVHLEERDEEGEMGPGISGTVVDHVWADRVVHCLRDRVGGHRKGKEKRDEIAEKTTNKIHRKIDGDDPQTIGQGGPDEASCAHHDRGTRARRAGQARAVEGKKQCGGHARPPAFMWMSQLRFELRETVATVVTSGGVGGGDGGDGLAELEPI